MSTLRMRQALPTDECEAYLDISLDRHGGPPVLMIVSHTEPKDSRFVHYYMNWGEAQDLYEKLGRALSNQAEGDKGEEK